MVVFFVKLILTPLLIAGTTLATRRWGPTVGGWLVGLPLTSGPVSVFLAVEQGSEFAAASALGALCGQTAVVTFCLAYERCLRFPWPVAATVAILCNLAVVAAFSMLAPSMWVAAAITTSAITAVFLLIKPVTVKNRALAAPRWDLPFRMLTATSIVLGITMMSRSLGPQLSGLLSTFPVFITVMSVFSHKLYGEDATRKFERGVAEGSYAFVAFFLIVSLTIASGPLPFVYLGALAGALLTNLVVYAVLSRCHSL